MKIETAAAMINREIENQVGLSLDDLADTPTVADHVDTLSEMEEGSAEAKAYAKEAAREILQEEGLDL